MLEHPGAMDDLRRQADMDQDARREAARERHRRYRARRRVQQHATCLMCSTPLVGLRADARYCSSACHSRARDARTPKPRRWIEPTRCVDCPARILVPPKGFPPKRCPSCRDAHRAARHREGRARDPEKYRAWGRKAGHLRYRRAHRAGALVERFSHREIFERDDWVCQLCQGAVNPNTRFPDRWSASLDHKIPLARGGLHTRENSQLAHLTCNRRKHTKIMEVA